MINKISFTIPSGKTVKTLSSQESDAYWQKFSDDSDSLALDDNANEARRIAKRISEATTPPPPSRSARRRRPISRRANTQKTTAVAIDKTRKRVYIAQQGNKWNSTVLIEDILSELERKYSSVNLCQANSSRIPNMHAEMIIVACLRGRVKNLLFASAQLHPCPACACTLVNELDAKIEEVGNLPNLTWVHPTEFYALQKP